MSGRQLTCQEIVVLRLLADGLNNGAVARELRIGTATVQRHVENARYKLCASNRTHAVAIAIRIGVI